MTNVYRNPDLMDKANTKFYAKFPHPLRFDELSRFGGPDFELMMLSHRLGDFNHGRMPATDREYLVREGAGPTKPAYTTASLSSYLRPCRNSFEFAKSVGSFGVCKA